MKIAEALIQMDNDWDTDYIFEIFFLPILISIHISTHK